MCLVLFTLVAGRSDAADIRRVDITMKHDWAEATKYILEVRMNRSISGGWRMALLFTKPVARLEMWRAVRLGGNNERTLHSIKNMYFNANLAKGELLTFALVVYKVKRGETRANVTGIFLPGKVVPTFSPVHVSYMEQFVFVLLEVTFLSQRWIIDLAGCRSMSQTYFISAVVERFMGLV